ncbi:unnamed protein product [Cunninghamella blakesleeana]
MSVAIAQPHRISRKLTISEETVQINIRPIVKGAIKEAAHTLSDAFVDNNVLERCTNGQGDYRYSFFKNIIDTATLQSRDYVIQVEGCKGAAIWTNQKHSFSWPSTTKLARMVGWANALKSALQYQPWSEKHKKRIMADYDEYMQISYIGILPHEQRKGYGSALLKHIIEKADNSHYPIFVEVTDSKAIPLFERHGFLIKYQKQMSNQQDLPVTFMVREPLPTATDPIPLRLKPGRQNSDNTI